MLARLAHQGESAFIGCCCRAFAERHHRLFQQSSLDCILIDIEDQTCYELDQATAAYQGRFQRQTTLRLEALEWLLEQRQRALPGAGGKAAS